MVNENHMQLSDVAERLLFSVYESTIEIEGKEKSMELV